MSGLTQQDRTEVLRTMVTTPSGHLEPWEKTVEAIVARHVAAAEIAGQMKHITAEMVRGDQPLEAQEELIADLRARLSHVEAERDEARAELARICPT